MEREHSVSKAPLAVSQRILRGLVTTFFESGAAVLEGVVLYYYNDKKKVSTEYLGLANFVVGILTVYFSIVIGNLGDRSTSKYRRKPLVMLFAPMYAVGLFFRYGAFTSNSNAPVYYVVTLAIQVIGRTGMSITNDAWNMELSNEEVDRGRLYSTMTAVGVAGILLGLAMTAVPLILDGVFMSLGIIVSHVANVVMIPEGTPMEKRCFIPMVTNISSVMWNSQYRVYLATMSMVWFLNSVPPLLLFFLRYAVGQNEVGAQLSYTLCLAAFIFVGFLALPCIPKLIETKGKQFTANISLYGIMVCGVVMFGASYLSPYAVIALFGIVGFFSTLSNTIFSVIAADIVDYDELLTGMKRAASYTGTTNLPFMFISIGGSSIPLVLMSVLGFEEPSDDDGDDNDDGNSTEGSTAVLRVWCSLFLSMLGVAAFLIFKNYKIDNDVHIKILENIAEREGGDVADEDPQVGAPRDSRASQASATEDVNLKSVLLENFVSSTPDTDLKSAKIDISRPLDCVQDPITGQPVLPPPYVTTGRVLQSVMSDLTHASLTLGDKDTLRLLGEYFPLNLMMCGTVSGRRRLHLVAAWKYLLYFLLVALGLWQSVRTLIRRDEYGSYLIVLLTAVYSIFLAWELLYIKGYITLRNAEKGSNFKEVEACLLRAGEIVDGKCGPGLGNCSTAASGQDGALLEGEANSLVKDTVLSSVVLAVSFVSAFIVLNF